MDNLKHIVKAYEIWVAKNPDTVCDVETTAKWLSYFIAGRISDSTVVTELIYSLSNLLVLYNDRIIAKDRKEKGEKVPGEIEPAASGFCYRLKVMLTTLEYCEVFIEISAKRVFGNKGKWVFIAGLQVLKAAGRFFILKHSTEQIITSPAMPALNRRALKNDNKNSRLRSGCQQTDNKNSLEEHNFTFKLKRSGRVVRKVEGAPPLHYRSFKLNEELETMQKSQVPKILLQAEYLYIAKPLIHLASMGMFGEKSWKQFVVSLAVDISSINMYRRNRHLMSKQQQLILSHRCINLLLYLMRTPFYEKFTQSRLERILGFIANHVPIAKMVAGPLREYIPHWQSTYFYLWST
ncbi:peroxisomal membrane protein PEX16 [Calliphora vicina]|uniref:peroxisomal membrane protein PEX16 n=1 Tax=Calliphora vicina TaxID=7373 RepID=UPI00325AD2A4